MRVITLPIRAIAFVIATRAALAAGIGLLLAERIPADRRRKIATVLIAFGAITTIPAVRLASRAIKRSNAISPVHRDPTLIGARRFPRKGDDFA
jgi:hypothetical protein